MGLTLEQLSMEPRFGGQSQVLKEAAAFVQ